MLYCMCSSLELVSGRLQYTDERQASVALVKVHTISDDELVGDLWNINAHVMCSCVLVCVCMHVPVKGKLFYYFLRILFFISLFPSEYLRSHMCSHYCNDMCTVSLLCFLYFFSFFPIQYLRSYLCSHYCNDKCTVYPT